MTATPVLSPTIPTKGGQIATIGSHQPQAWQIVTRMVAEQGWHLVDIRYGRNSYQEEWSGACLRRHFRSSYHAVPELGDVNHLAPQNPIQLADPSTGLAKVDLLLEAGFDCLLLCACPDWQRCHRCLVASLLTQVYPQLSVTHLVPDECAVDLPLWCFETVALLQRYGLLSPLPHTAEEQPVLLRTTRSQGVVLPGYGQCTLGLTLCLWMSPQAERERQAACHERHPASASTAPGPDGSQRRQEEAAVTERREQRRTVIPVPLQAEQGEREVKPC
jgi:hypothetical protein